MLGLDVYDYAFLRGGPRAAFFAALGDLEHRGCLKVAASRATALARPSADVGPLPQAIFAAAERWPDSTASELGGDPDVAAALAAIERKLTSRDLWRNGRRIGLGFAPIPTIWIAGASAAAVYALSTQRRLENAVATFVVVGAAVLALFLLARAALGRGAGPTALGKRVLEDARRSRTPAAAPRDARTAAARHGATPMLDPLWQFALWGPLLHGSPAFAAGAFPPGAGGLPWATGGSVDAWSVGVDGSLSESASASAWSADSGASTSVEPMFGGGSSGGGFGGDWSSGGGADSGGGGFDGGGGGGGGDSGGGGGGGGD